MSLGRAALLPGPLLVGLLLATPALGQSPAPMPLRAAMLHADTTDAPVRRPPDDWIAVDKAQHLAGSFLLTLGGQYVLVNKAELDEGEAWPVAAGVALGLGVAKEVADGRRRRRPHFSWRDLAADAVGVGLAVGVILL